MSVHRYSLRSLAPDYARGLIGAAVSLGALALIPAMSVMTFVFAGLTALFALFTIRTALRQRTCVELTERSISSRPGDETPVAWNEIEGLKLRYYSTRRARDRGWMTLKLVSPRRSIVVDSNLDGFEAIVARAAEAASRNHLDLSETTRANLASLGLPVNDGSASDRDSLPRRSGPMDE